MPYLVDLRRRAPPGKTDFERQAADMAQGYVTRRGKMWYAIWVDSEGNTRSKSVSMQESEARLFLERRKMEVELARKHDCEAVLFEQAAEEYIARVLPTAYKPSTVVNMTSDLKAHLVPFFKDAYVCEISARDLDSFIAERIIDDGASSGKTLREINTFRQFMNTAVTWRYASYNPGYLVKIKARNVNSISFLRPVELKSLFEHANPAWRPYLMTAGLTGMRCGELAGLFERDVDFTEHKIRVRRSVYAGKYDTPKTASAIRDIDMPPSLERELRAWVDSPLRLKTQTGILFPSRYGNPPTSFVGNKIALQPALEAAGLPKIRLHDLRHTYASILIANRESLKYIQRMLGHRSVKTTVDTYGHLIDESNMPAARRLDEAVFLGKKPAGQDGRAA